MRTFGALTFFALPVPFGVLNGLEPSLDLLVAQPCTLSVPVMPKEDLLVHVILWENGLAAALTEMQVFHVLIRLSRGYLDPTTPISAADAQGFPLTSESTRTCT